MREVAVVCERALRAETWLVSVSDACCCWLDRGQTELKLRAFAARPLRHVLMAALQLVVPLPVGVVGLDYPREFVRSSSAHVRQKSKT